MSESPFENDSSSSDSIFITLSLCLHDKLSPRVNICAFLLLVSAVEFVSEGMPVAALSISDFIYSFLAVTSMGVTDFTNCS